MHETRLMEICSVFQIYQQVHDTSTGTPRKSQSIRPSVTAHMVIRIPLKLHKLQENRS